MAIDADNIPLPPSLSEAESAYVRSATRKELPNIALTARLEAVRDSGKAIGIQNDELTPFKAHCDYKTLR